MFTRFVKKDEGFTLIELMIVIAIIGILAAIAIPQFNAYRARSYNASSNTDIRNAMTAQEGYYIDKDEYANGANGLAALTANYGLLTSDGSIVRVTGNTTTYSVLSYNSKAGSYAVTYTVTGPGGDIFKITP